ncbi:MAG: LTA synthase family protein [Cellulosilyticaceae bacterium]
MREKIIGIIKVVGIVAVLSFLILLCGEGIIRQDFMSVFKWIRVNPIGFLMNYIVLFAFFMGLSCTLNRMSYSFLIVTLIYITVCVVCYYKYSLSGEYLIPSDLIMMGEAASISKDMHITMERHVVQGVLFSLFLIVMAFKFDMFNMHKRYRVVFASLFAVLCLSTAVVGAKVFNKLSGQGVSDVQSTQTVNEQYHNNGFILGFSQEINQLIVEEPEGYSNEQVASIMAEYDLSSRQPMAVKPNIIMIMSESLFDVTRFEGVSYSQNPLAHFQEAQNAYGKGSVVTEVYGGKTCQTEYEVLTGNSVAFTKPENIAYLRFVEPETSSIPKLLKEEGYDTYAIHSYEGSFYSRDRVYKDLGIDHFMDQASFADPTTIRGYISDQDVTDKIIETYEAKGTSPMFCHVVTMQNHMPYEVSYNGQGVTVGGKKLSGKSKTFLETYVNGLRASDVALGELLDYFSKVKEPTVIVMYGDHLPALGDQYDVYRRAGYIKGTFDKEDCLQLYQTPLLVWNNYGLPKKDFGYIDATYVGAMVLDYIGYHGDAYMNLLESANRVLPAYNETFVIDHAGMLKDARKLTDSEQEVMTKLRLVQYHRLFGRENSILWEWIDKKKED